MLGWKGSYNMFVRKTMWGIILEKSLGNSLRVKWLRMEYTKIRTVIYHLLLDGYGTKRISTIMKENETGIGLYGRMMALFCNL